MHCALLHMPLHGSNITVAQPQCCFVALYKHLLIPPLLVFFIVCFTPCQIPSPWIFHFCFVAPPSVLVLGLYFFREMKTREKEFFEEVLFIDVIVGLVVVFMYFWSFLSESLFGATAVKRTVMCNIVFVTGACVYRLYTTYALAADDGAAAKMEPLYVLYTLVRNYSAMLHHVQHFDVHFTLYKI
jgi:hypothetical protein